MPSVRQLALLRSMTYYHYNKGFHSKPFWSPPSPMRACIENFEQFRWHFCQMGVVKLAYGDWCDSSTNWAQCSPAYKEGTGVLSLTVALCWSMPIYTHFYWPWFKKSLKLRLKIKLTVLLLPRGGGGSVLLVRTRISRGGWVRTPLQC